MQKIISTLAVIASLAVGTTLATAGIHEVYTYEIGPMGMGSRWEVGDSAAAEEARERIAEAQTIVRGAIDAGRWTDASRDELRQRMSSLPRAELDQMMSELFVALNAGRVRADVHGPLL